MNHFKKLIMTAVLAYSPFGFCNLTFICHKGLNYDQALVKRAYTGQIDEPQLSDNKKLRPELLSLIHMDANAYRRMWSKQFFRRAINPPDMRNDDNAVIAFVRHFPQGVGYVSEKPQDMDGIEVCGQ